MENHQCGSWRHKAKSAGLLWLRLLMGLAIASHGYQKVFGGVVEQLAQGLTQWGWPMPSVFAWMAALSEFVGGLCIALGLGTRIAGFFVFVTMSVAFFVAHAKDPFQVKELAFLFGAVASALVLTGAGRYSLDALFCRKHCKEDKPN